jgi:uncharacterized protein
LRAQAAGDTSSLDERSAYWLAIPIPIDAVTPGISSRQRTSAAREEGDAAWDALSSLNEALLGSPLQQYETGMRYLLGDGVTRDKALGDAWLRRAQTSFAVTPGLRVYADAARVVEERVGAGLTADEQERAHRLAENLLATVPVSTASMVSN